MIADEVIDGVWGHTLDGDDLGLVEDGFTHILEYHDGKIDNTHLYQRSVLDLICQGGGARCLFSTMARANAAVGRLMAKYDNAVGEMPSSGERAIADLHTFEHDMTAAQGGVQGYDFGDGSAIAGPASITAADAIAMEDWDFRNNLNAQPEQMQVQLRYLPFEAASSIYFFRTNNN